MILAKKSLGQNFLMHQSTADRIADAALIEGKTVLEIGPGTGMLTRALLARAEKVIAVEADHTLCEILKETFALEVGEGKLTLIHADIRNFDAGSIEGEYALVANIPYYLTGEIIRTFLSGVYKPTSMTVLVQKEVAERIARSKKESLLSLSVKVYGTPKVEFKVPRGAFVPAPNVDSAVLSIRDIHSPFLSSTEEEFFFTLLHAGFGHKRKQLLKNLEGFVPREKAKEALTKTGLPEKVRAEDLSLTDWQSLAHELA